MYGRSSPLARSRHVKAPVFVVVSASGLACFVERHIHGIGSFLGLLFRVEPRGLVRGRCSLLARNGHVETSIFVVVRASGLAYVVQRYVFRLGRLWGLQFGVDPRVPLSTDSAEMFVNFSGQFRGDQYWIVNCCHIGWYHRIVAVAWAVGEVARLVDV